MTWTAVGSVQLTPNWLYTQPIAGYFFRITQSGHAIAGSFLLAQTSINDDGTLSIFDTREISSKDTTAVVEFRAPGFLGKDRRIAIRYNPPDPDIATVLRNILNPAVLMPGAVTYISRRSDWILGIEVSDEQDSSAVDLFNPLKSQIDAVKGSVDTLTQQANNVNSSVLQALPQINSTNTQVKRLLDSFQSGGGLQSSTIYNTAQLDPNATENGTIKLGQAFELLKIQSSVPARIRLYSSQAALAADQNRKVATDPLPGQGVIFDGVTTQQQPSINCSPVVKGANLEVAQTDSISLSVTNLGSTKSTISLVFIFIPIL